MKKQNHLALIESGQEIQLQAGSPDYCLVNFQEQGWILSYDAAYELALKLASWLEDGTVKGHSVS